MSRRSFTQEQKQSIVAELDGGADLKALLARENLTHAHIAAFRKSIGAKDTTKPAMPTLKKVEVMTGQAILPTARGVESLGEIVLKRLDSLEEKLTKLAAAVEPSKQLLEIQTQLDKITAEVTKPKT